MHKCFADSISLQHMLTDSPLACKRMLIFPPFFLKVPCSKVVVAETTGCPDSDLNSLFCSALRSQVSFRIFPSRSRRISKCILNMDHRRPNILASHVQHNLLRLCFFWRFCSSLRRGLSVTACSFIMPLNMIRWEYVSGAHPLPKGSFVEETCYFLIFQQLYLCRPWTDVDFAFEELRIDSFRGGRQAMSPMIFRSRRKIACCSRKSCAFPHTQKKLQNTCTLA